MSVLPAYVYLHIVCMQCLWVQKWVSDLLDVELQKVVSCHVSPGSQTGVLWESGQRCLLHLLLNRPSRFELEPSCPSIQGSTVVWCSQVRFALVIYFLFFH